MAQEGERVVQRNQGLEGKLFKLEVFDFQIKDDVEKEIEHEANRIQAAIDLETGPLVHLGLFKTTSNSGHAFLERKSFYNRSFPIKFFLQGMFDSKRVNHCQSQVSVISRKPGGLCQESDRLFRETESETTIGISEWGIGL